MRLPSESQRSIESRQPRSCWSTHMVQQCGVRWWAEASSLQRQRCPPQVFCRASGDVLVEDAARVGGVAAAGEVQVLGEERGPEVGDGGAVVRVEPVEGGLWVGAVAGGWPAAAVRTRPRVGGDGGDAGLVVAALVARCPSQRVPQQRQRRRRIAGCGVGQGEDVGAADGLSGEGVVESVSGQGLGPPGRTKGMAGCGSTRRRRRRRRAVR